MQDVTADRARVIHLEQVQQLGGFGGCSYDRRSGWGYDDALLAMWGVEDCSCIEGLPRDLLSPDNRAADIANWSSMLLHQGRHSLSYSVIHGLTGEVRHLRCTASTVVGSAGILVQVVATHVDVTDVMAAGASAELERAAAAEERSRLLRRLGEMLATSRLGLDELLGAIVDLASVTIGEGAAIRILSADHRAIERDMTAHPDESVRLRLAGSLQRSVRDPVPSDGITAKSVQKEKPLADVRQRDRRPEYQKIFAERVFDQAAHMMLAPVRHDGIELGKLAVFRTNSSNPYRPGDDEILQMLADGAGTAIAESRARQKKDQERNEALSSLRSQQLDLLERLAGMETRERSLLAEAIHDEPIQRIVAGILRLDHIAPRLDPTTRAEVDEIADQLVSTVDWLRDLIVVTLTAPNLTAGLGPALAGLARSIFTATGTVFSVAGPHHVPLSVPAKEAAFRIFREALSNVRKHANAHTATLRLEHRDNFIVISLTDDGVGSANLHAGVGHLGMASMRARADAEGGQFRVESVPGLGTVVTLLLPAQQAPKMAGKPLAGWRSSPSQLESLSTIVVCDDHQYLRDAIKLVLATVPRFRVVGEASDGAACLERVKSLCPDILILDVNMPGGGPGLAVAVKKLNPDLRLVVFSGRQEESTKQAMLAAGADEYIVKTGRLEPLVEALDRVTSTKHEAPPWPAVRDQAATGDATIPAD